ncbi:hypothetical protein [Actinomadura miaoliensis]|uniref:Uncharacterized protein n=1 Tax=Actinomadura miaoliensis TaxID=430685 RepID=A0ABP7V3H8_9ACTN
MTVPPAPAGPVKWDTHAVTTYLRRRYPRVQVWWSEPNQAWMAIVLRPTSHPVGDELLEAVTPAELERRLQAAGVRPVRPQQAAPTPAQHSAPDRSSPPRPALRPVYGRHEAPRPPWWRRVVGAFVQLDDNEW